MHWSVIQLAFVLQNKNKRQLQEHSIVCDFEDKLYGEIKTSIVWEIVLGLKFLPSPKNNLH